MLWVGEPTPKTLTHQPRIERGGRSGPPVTNVTGAEVRDKRTVAISTRCGSKEATVGAGAVELQQEAQTLHPALDEVACWCAWVA